MSRDGRESRGAILEAALQLFSERGFHGTSVPMILQRAGVSTGSMYNHFRGGKDELVNVVYKQTKRRLQEYLWLDFPIELPFREQHRELWLRWINLIRTDLQGLVFIELHHHGPYLDDESRELRQAVIDSGRQFYREGQSQGLMKKMPTNTMVMLAWGAFVGLLTGIRFGRIFLDDDTIADTETLVWDMLSER